VPENEEQNSEPSSLPAESEPGAESESDAENPKASE
jgi:hypothetical protein